MHFNALVAIIYTLLSSHIVVSATHLEGHARHHNKPDTDLTRGPVFDLSLSPQSLNPKLRTLPLAPRDLPTGTCNKDTPCVNKACCGTDGLCGYSPKSCGIGCYSNCDAKAQCGQYAPAGSQKCPLNVCCSEFGFCGSTDDFCKWKGCDTQWGGCGDPNRPSCKGGHSVAKRTVGYYESWSSTRKCQQVMPEDLNLNGFTHLNFAFAFFDPKSLQIAPMDSNSGSLYNRVTGLKSKVQGLETWISVGGWSFTDPGPTRTAFSDMASNQGSRKTFIDGLMKFMDTYGFDGVDLDWEYPVADDRGGRPDDTANYVQLAKELRAAFGTKYGISMTLPTSFWYLQNFDLVGIQESIDWFNLMAYDLHGTWDAESKYVGPYIAPHTNDTEIDLGLDLLWRAGVRPENVVMGQGWYGRSFTLKDPKCSTPNGVCEFTSGAKPGPCSNAAGILDLQEIKDIIKTNNLKPQYDEKANVKWISWDNDQWVSFDDDQTFKAKKDFANDRCLGGLMVWAMDQVDQTASNGLGPAPNITPQQQKNVNKMGSNLNAGTTCYTSKCDQKCSKNFHEVAQMTGQPGDLSTQPRCGLDKKKNQLHESLCCPSGTTMGQCTWRGWRGVGLSCNSGCADGETEVAKNTNHIDKKENQSCSGGLQSYCCAGFKPPPPPQKKKSLGEKIKESFEAAGQNLKKDFDKLGEDIKNFAEGALIDIASTLVCRIIVPAVMGVAEVAEDIVPVGGEIADAAEIAATPEIVDACSNGINKALGPLEKGKGAVKPRKPEQPAQSREPTKSHSSAPQSRKPTETRAPTDTRKPESTQKPTSTRKSSTTSSSTESYGTSTLQYGPLPTEDGLNPQVVGSNVYGEAETLDDDTDTTSTIPKRSAWGANINATQAELVRRLEETQLRDCPLFEPEGVTTAYKICPEQYEDYKVIGPRSGWLSDSSGIGSPKLSRLAVRPDTKEAFVTEHVFEKRTLRDVLQWMSKGVLPSGGKLDQGKMPVTGLFDQKGIFNNPWPSTMNTAPAYGRKPLNTAFGCLGHKQAPANEDNLQVVNRQLNGKKTKIANFERAIGPSRWKDYDGNKKLIALTQVLNVFNYYNLPEVQASHKAAYKCLHDVFWPAFASYPELSEISPGAADYEYGKAFEAVVKDYLSLSAKTAKTHFDTLQVDAIKWWRTNPAFKYTKGSMTDAKKHLDTLKADAIKLIQFNTAVMM